MPVSPFLFYLVTEMKNIMTLMFVLAFQPIPNSTSSTVIIFPFVLSNSILE